MTPVSGSTRTAIRLNGWSETEHILLATLNRFHFRSVILVTEGSAPFVLYHAGRVFLGDPNSFSKSEEQTSLYCRVEGGPNGPVPLSRRYLDELSAFLSPYLSPIGKLDNRRPGLSDPAMDELADAFEAEILRAVGLPPANKPRSFGLSVTADVDVVGKSVRANIVSGLVFLRNALRCLFQPYRALFQVSLAARFLSGRVDYCGFETILSMASSQGYTPEFFLYAQLPEGNRLSLRQRILGVNPNYALEWGVMQVVMARLVCAGACVGLHGSYRSYSDEELLALEKRHLERHVGQQCVSIRQHYLNLSAETFSAYARLGIAYESNCGFVTRNGFSSRTTRPFYVWPPEKDGSRGVVAVPMVFMDAVPLYFEPRTPLETEGDIFQIIRTLKRYGGMGAVNFHQRMVQSIPEYAKILASAVSETQKLGGAVGPLSMVEELYPEPEYV